MYVVQNRIQACDLKNKNNIYTQRELVAFNQDREVCVIKCGSL